jgi:hypothetical protein
MEETVNTVHNEVKKILMNYVGDTSKPETCDIVKKELDRYFISVSEKLGYPYLPVVKAEIEGPFLTLNFFNEAGTRLETFGDLVYYMDTGKIQTNVAMEI